jgi:hypothetical protein
MVSRIFAARNVFFRLALSFCVVLFFLTSNAPNAQESNSALHSTGHTISLRPVQRRLLDHAERILAKSPLSPGERQVRLNAVESVLTGTVAVADDDNPEIRNPRFWKLQDDGYVVAPNQTAADAISDLWILHDNDEVPIPRIWCYKYSSLLMVRAYIKYFRDTRNAAGLAAINELLGHKNFPGDLTREEVTRLWKQRLGNDNLLPGDQVWFDNPYFDKGSALIRQRAYKQAIRDGETAAEAKKIAERAVDSLAVGEEGSNVFYLGDNRFARGAVSVVRIFHSAAREANRKDVTGYDQVYTQKVFTLSRYQQHMIDDYFTVQACLEAAPGSVRPGDFQIKRIRLLVDPERSFPARPERSPAQPLDRLIDALASRNPAPQLLEQDNRRAARCAHDYDWNEQRRVRSAMLAVLAVKSDSMWWRLREHAADSRYALTASRNDRARNFSVGEFCSDFAAADLALPYARHLPAVVGRLPAEFHPEDVFVEHEQEWKRTGKLLYEIQIAICQRALVQWSGVKGTVAGEEGLGHAYTSDEKNRFAAALAKEIAELRRTRRAAFLEPLLPGVAAPGGWEGFDEQSEP